MAFLFLCCMPSSGLWQDVATGSPVKVSAGRSHASFPWKTNAQWVQILFNCIVYEVKPETKPTFVVELACFTWQCLHSCKCDPCSCMAGGSGPSLLWQCPVSMWTYWSFVSFRRRTVPHPYTAFALHGSAGLPESYLEHIRYTHACVQWTNKGKVGDVLTTEIIGNKTFSGWLRLWCSKHPTPTVLHWFLRELVKITRRQVCCYMSLYHTRWVLGACISLQHHCTVVWDLADVVCPRPL